MWSTDTPWKRIMWDSSGIINDSDGMFLKGDGGKKGLRDRRETLHRSFLFINMVESFFQTYKPFDLKLLLKGFSWLKYFNVNKLLNY